MPIKQSLLESKWYYRVAKVFFAILPVFIIAWILISRRVFIQGQTMKDLLELVQINKVNLVYGVIGIVAYILIVKWVWRGFLYIVFGGLENDVVKKTNAPVAATVGKMDKKDSSEVGSLIGLLIILGCIYYAYFIYKPSNDIFPNPLPSPKCISTGCGKEWRCNGTYYDSSGKKISVNSCFSTANRPNQHYSSWSGTCRQCP